MARINFAFKMLAARFNPERRLCPYCESRHSLLLQRKWLIIQARKCHYCGLIFRWPTDRTTHTQEFYESDYEGQQATELPDDSELDRLIANHFINTQYDKSHRIRFLNQQDLGKSTLLDFGSSWGYSTYQYKQADLYTYLCPQPAMYWEAQPGHLRLGA